MIRILQAMYQGYFLSLIHQQHIKQRRTLKDGRQQKEGDYLKTDDHIHRRRDGFF